MTISPSTDLYLLKVPIELNDENQLTFATAAAQATYFLGLTKIGETDFTYQRRDNAIRYPAHIDSILQYNYVMYKNENYSNKWFYARITDMQYINDNMTLVEIQEDAFQTWQFDLSYSQCFVEREHVNDDTIGLHTVPEGLEIGEAISNFDTGFWPNRTATPSGGGAGDAFTNSMMIVFQVTELPVGTYGIDMPHQYNSVYNGMFYFGVTSPDNATSMIAKYAAESKPNSIVAIFMAPTAFFDGAQFSNIMTSGGNVTIYFPVQTIGYSPLLNDGGGTISRPSKLDGYTPKNNKLLTWPFSYILIDNNAGTCVTERYEDFYTPATPSWKMMGALGQGCSIKLVPYKYKGSGNTTGYESNYSEGVVGMKFPICGWASDYYTNWLTQNALNIPMTIATGLAGLAVGGYGLGTSLVTGGMGKILGAGAVTLGAGSRIGSLVSQMYQASLVPDQAQGNANMSDLNMGIGRCFSVKCMSIKSEYAQIADAYFQAYGYKVNTIKTPNITGRTNWNYVKTVGSAIHADIPQDTCDHINEMFDRGITLWHNPTTFRDYSQSNTIVTPPTP